MSQIQIEKIRIKNFRSLRNVEVNLNTLTLLVGTNNAGKTTFLRALNAVLGVSRSLLNKDDLFINEKGECPENNVLIDIKVIPVNNDGKRIAEFHGQWGGVFGAGENIGTENDSDFFAFRSTFNFQGDDMPEAEYTLITDWENEKLGPVGDFKRIQQVRNNIRMYYIDAQRDIEQDLRLRTSYFGKMASRIEDDYQPDDIKELTQLIEKINESAVKKSPILKHLKSTLSNLNQTTNSSGTGVDISPFSRNIRDLHKGMKVDFQDQGSERFSMEYHGMGTRSWASILTSGAYIEWELQLIAKKVEMGQETSLLFPIIALEEPEAHLHPNAQRTLYSQMKVFMGQKIISTHSPYIAGQAELEELRHFYKAKNIVEVSQIQIARIEEEKIVELKQEIEAAGATTAIHLKNRPIIASLETIAKSKLSTEDERKIKKEIIQKNGDILFSKAIVLFEGETELFSLPVFAKNYFNIEPFSFGLTFVDVGGKNGYKPFLYIAKFLKIPCFIFSDADGDTIQKVKKQVAEVHGLETAVEIIDLDSGLDYEDYLVAQSFERSICTAIDAMEDVNDYIKTHYIPNLDGQKGKGGMTRSYSTSDGEKRAILDCMKENKTKYAEKIAIEIVKAGVLPSKIRNLFDKVNADLEVITTKPVPIIAGL